MPAVRKLNWVKNPFYGNDKNRKKLAFEVLFLNLTGKAVFMTNTAYIHK